MKRKSTQGSTSEETPPQSTLGMSDAVEPPPEAPSLEFTSVAVEQPVAHLLLRTSGVLDENSVTTFFQRASEILLASKPKRVLVDLRESKVTLSISDMHGLVKMAASGLSGLVGRLAVVLKESDILTEKFFEPALTRRGLPTLATTDYEEALYWLSSKLRPGI